jgi:hypothetical protein
MKRKPEVKDYIVIGLLISYALYIRGIAILTIINHQ